MTHDEYVSYLLMLHNHFFLNCKINTIKLCLIVETANGISLKSAINLMIIYELMIIHKVLVCEITFIEILYKIINLNYD